MLLQRGCGKKTLHLVGKNVVYDDRKCARARVCMRACVTEWDVVTETSHGCEYVCAWSRKRNRGMNREKCQAEDSALFPQTVIITLT